jgi:farnesyl-diphosphate farnesyltransferase
MTEPESHHERELGGQLLASVSRSFYLTLKALPAELREPISLAYLLARTADTIADTAEAPAALRLECLDVFETLVTADPPPHSARQVLASRIHQDFTRCQKDEAERRLMERFTEGLDWLATLRGAALEAIRQVLRSIIQGQRLDILRFPADGQMHCLSTAQELDDYTWLVAGCVGEFWTEMCAQLRPESLAPSQGLAALKAQGARFGKGLQLINILRDLGEDLADGRCYLPGFSAAEVHRDSRVLEPAWQHWLGICGEHLGAGLDYVTQVADGRLRYATALPLFIGVKTLAKMQALPWPQRLAGVKIGRIEVTMILAEAAVACRSPAGARRLFAKLSEGACALA